MPLYFAVTTNPCSDGTPYGRCSTVTPGKYCIGVSSSPSLIDGASMCPCPSGYITNGDVCDAQSCSDGTAYNACSTISKGKRCENGQLVDKASSCGCPSGNYLVSGESCIANAGCLSNSDGSRGPITCSPDKYCDSQRGNATYNSCVLKGGCQYNNPGCTSSQDCQADGTCKLKSGCQYNNPACSSDMVCRNNQCAEKSAFDAINPVNSIANASTPDSTGANSLSCCCLPAGASLITLAGAFAIKRRRESA